MNKPSNKNLAIFGGIGLFFIATFFVACLAKGVYLDRSDSKFVRTFGSWLPAAKIDGEKISYGEVLQTRDTLKTYLKSDAAKAQGFAQDLTPDLEKKATVERLIRDRIVEGLAREKKIELNGADIQAEYEKMILAASTTMPNVSEFLSKSFGWNEEDFRKNVVRPALLENRVSMTYGTSTEEQIMGFQQDVENRMKSDKIKIYLKY
ncbi:SurA N-terminal domain-containing protein [Candidatus Uhrbacteria bacterium]|nr:SurA N-terminal domain-containing protein [Candidatus Uhrbacteria bacterium]